MSAIPTSTRIDLRQALLVFLAVLALALPQATLLPLLDRDEPRFAEASREMLQSGNFIVPTFNNAPRYAKPPLIYWCQCLSYEIFGENAFAARLPSLLATAATACLLFTWGVRLGGGIIGWAAALSYAFCVQTIQQGRVATADALLIFFMTLTAFTGWQIIRPRDGSRCSLWCFALLPLCWAGGFLAKGPEAWLPFLALMWCARGSRFYIVQSFIIGVAFVLLWAIPAYIQTHGDYWRIGMSEGVGKRMVTGLQGHGASTAGWYTASFFYYVLLFWISALPWSPLILIHRRKLFSGWKIDPTDTYLILNAALIFVVFTFMVTKLPHYTLPAFPFLALLFARRWNAIFPVSTLPGKLGWGVGTAFALVAAIGIPIALANHATPSPVGELVRLAGNNLTPETQFALVDFQEPNAIWEMRRVTRSYGKVINESEIVPFLNEPGSRAVLVTTSVGERFGAMTDSAWKIQHAHGFNAAKGRFIDLTLIVKP